MFFWLKKAGLAQGRPKNLPTYLGCMLPSDKNFPSWEEGSFFFARKRDKKLGGIFPAFRGCFLCFSGVFLRFLEGVFVVLLGCCFVVTRASAIFFGELIF